ncbi:MAG: aldose 1-epimerase family protein [Clostridia bacterium]|nr:aldose 1-epimerase family protein [Clostridia bacterium]
MNTQIKTARASAVCSTVGGELISYKLDGKEYIWEGIPEYWASHAPVLFPTVGATIDESVKFEGVAYPLKKHGLARKMEFTLLEAESDKLVYLLTDSAETRKVYPYKFRLLITHKITDEGFSTEFKVVNTDEKPIVFCIGGHPGFRCPMNEGEKFSDYKLVFEKVENEDVIYTTNYGGGYIDKTLPVVDKLKNTNEWELNHADYDVDVLLTKKLKSRKVKLVHKVTGKGIEFDFNGFNALGVWTPPKKQAPFVCLEPWNGLPAHLDETGNFEDKPYAITLPVGGEYAVEYKVKVID